MKVKGYGIVLDRLYIPVDFIDPFLHQAIVRNFTKTIKVFVSPQVCNECYREGEGEVPCEQGITCPHKYKRLVMFDKVKLKSYNCIAVWRGDIPLLKEVFKGFKVRDRRSAPKAIKKLKFTGTLRPYQKEAVDKWLKAKYGGMIKAPARSGKTVQGTYITCVLGLKTLILTHQIDLLYQFYDTFKDFTNLSSLSKPNIAIAEKGNIASLVKVGYDIILSTYQTFITKKGKFRFKKIINSFGLVIIDECHLLGGDCFSKVVTGINSKYRLGLTATPDRKDGRDILAKYAIGEVVASVDPPQLVGKAIFTFTGTSVGQFTNWATMLNRLSKNARRNKLIISFAEKDVREGHYVLLVTERRDQCDEIAKTLSERGIKTAILYGNIKDRQSLLNDIREGKYKITIATRKIVRYGLNVPPWSSYHCLSPTNNKPSFYQEMSRVRTPHPGKKEPIIRYYVDSFNAAMACMRTCEKVFRQEKFEVLREGVSSEIDSNARKIRKAKKETKDVISRWNSLAK